MLMGNQGLPWVLKQRFNVAGYHNIYKIIHELQRYGNHSCTAAPCEWNPETRTMDCSYRDMRDMDGLLEICEKVRNLNLDGNRLNDPKMLPPIMHQMEELRTLSVQDNEMSGEVDPETFKRNPDLSSVDFSSNKLNSIPPSVFESNFIMKELYFSDNELEEIPEDLLQNNPEIVYVDFSRNKVRKIPKTTFCSNHLIVKASLARNRIIKV